MHELHMIEFTVLFIVALAGVAGWIAFFDNLLPLRRIDGRLHLFETQLVRDGSLARVKELVSKKNHIVDILFLTLINDFDQVSKYARPPHGIGWSDYLARPLRVRWGEEHVRLKRNIVFIKHVASFTLLFSLSGAFASLAWHLYVGGSLDNEGSFYLASYLASGAMIIAFGFLVTLIVFLCYQSLHHRLAHVDERVALLIERSVIICGRHLDGNVRGSYDY